MILLFGFVLTALCALLNLFFGDFMDDMFDSDAFTSTMNGGVLIGLCAMGLSITLYFARYLP